MSEAEKSQSNIALVDATLPPSSPAGETPMLSAFRAWCELVRYSNEPIGETPADDDERFRRCALAIEVEQQIMSQPVQSGEDLAALCWVQLHILGYAGVHGDPVSLANVDPLGTGEPNPLPDAIAALYPRLVAVSRGRQKH